MAIRDWQPACRELKNPWGIEIYLVPVFNYLFFWDEATDVPSGVWDWAERNWPFGEQ